MGASMVWDLQYTQGRHMSRACSKRSAMCQKQILLSGPRAYYSMGWEQECPLRAQLPISASVVWRYHVVVGGDVGIDRLVTDFEDAPDAAADRQCPAVILIGFPVGSDEWACRQVPALREIIIEEGLQRHGIDVGAVLISGKGPKV